MAEQSKLEERLKRMTGTGGEGEKGNEEVAKVGKSKLDKALEDEDADLAEELKRTRAEEKLAQRNLNIKKIKKEATKSDGEEDTGGKPPAKRWSVIDGKPVEDPDGEYSTFAQALAMGNAAVRWTVVEGRPVESAEGEFRTFAQALQVAASERSGQDVKKWTIIDDKPIEDPDGEYPSFAAAYKVAYLGILKKEKVAETVNQGNSEQMRLMTSRMHALHKQLALALNPIETLKRAKAIKEDLEASGFVSPSLPGGSPENNVEFVKEKNRHEEEMKKADADREYKLGLVGNLSNLEETIGKGIGHDIRERAKSRSQSGPSESDGFEHLKCADCGTNITITPKTGERVPCPKCGAIWSRKPVSA